MRVDSLTDHCCSPPLLPPSLALSSPLLAGSAPPLLLLLLLHSQAQHTSTHAKAGRDTRQIDSRVTRAPSLARLCRRLPLSLPALASSATGSRPALALLLLPSPAAATCLCCCRLPLSCCWLCALLSTAPAPPTVSAPMARTMRALSRVAALAFPTLLLSFGVQSEPTFSRPSASHFHSLSLSLPLCEQYRQSVSRARLCLRPDAASAFVSESSRLTLVCVRH